MTMIERDTYDPDELDLEGMTVLEGTVSFDDGRTVGYVIDEYEADPLLRGYDDPYWDRVMTGECYD